MKFIKKYYLLLLLIMTLTGGAIYGTYAMFTSEIGVDTVRLNASTIPVDQEIMEYQKITINANDSKTIALNATNSTNQTLHYGAWYQMVSPSSINGNITIAKLTDSPNETSGTINASTNKNIYIYIGNNSSSTITLYVGIKYSETSNLGLPDNRTLITGTKNGKYIVNLTVTNGTSNLTYQKLNKGNSTTFNVTPNSGYVLESAICTNSSATYSNNVLSVNNIKGDVSCNVKFKKQLPPNEQTLEKLGLTSNGVKDTVTDVATTDEGVWETQDDYGTTYYFRGNVTNNYVQFAGFYWRIVRINGDGSIRLIYDGTSAHDNGESSTDRQIGTSAYNSTYGYNTYMGYMYGQRSSSNYSATHANINDSTIKEAVDNWYKTNIVDKGYSDKVADVIYCNDRQIASDSGSYRDYGTLGYGQEKTVYAPTSRIYTTSWVIRDVQEIKMTCSQKNDAFTVDDTTKGNGALIYPVALITMDEVLAAGGKVEIENSNYYLYTGQHYWIMSPKRFNGSLAYVFSVLSSGLVNETGVFNRLGVRPVISLTSSVQMSGSGTKGDPWKVN